MFTCSRTLLWTDPSSVQYFGYIFDAVLLRLTPRKFHLIRAGQMKEHHFHLAPSCFVSCEGVAVGCLIFALTRLFAPNTVQRLDNRKTVNSRSFLSASLPLKSVILLLLAGYGTAFGPNSLVHSIRILITDFTLILSEIV